jgi:chromosome segregation ATPase
MTADTAADGLRARISRQSEDALGKLAQELLESPFVSGALSRAFEAREKAAQAQEIAMGALNLPSAGDLERLTRRVRSVSQRLEGVEDVLDRVEERVGAMGGAGVSSLEQRLNAIEGQLSALAAQLADVAGQVGKPAGASTAEVSASAPPVTPAQRRTTRTRSAAASKRAAARRS